MVLHAVLSADLLLSPRTRPRCGSPPANVVVLGDDPLTFKPERFQELPVRLRLIVFLQRARPPGGRA